LYFIVFLVGLFVRPYVQYCLREGALELAECLDSPVNMYSYSDGREVADAPQEQAYTPSEQALLDRIARHDHLTGQITLAVILVALCALVIWWSGRVERRSA
jgi:hypothetical protein